MTDIRKDMDKKLALKLKTLERENRQLKIKLKQIMKNITHKLFFVALLLFGTTIYAQETTDEDWDDLEELEEVVLGAMMIDKKGVDEVIDILHPDTFYKESHKLIFNSIINLFDKQEPIDIKTVSVSIALSSPSMS